MNGLAILEPQGLWEYYLSNLGPGWTEFLTGTECACGPETDIVEGKENYLLLAELPGLTEKDFKVEYEQGVLTISGRWPEPPQGETATLRHERRTGEFSRSFSIPEDVELEHLEAKYTNGVLQLTLPKKEVVKPKTVRVEIH
jgi:HSP20 family protein